MHSVKNLPITAALCLFCIAGGLAYAGDIYTCTEASGKPLVSDRPIAACLDREQKQVLKSGAVKPIPPSYTIQEAAALEERKKQAELEQMKAQSKERSNRILVQRYPNLAAHQKARTAATGDVLSRIHFAQERMKLAKNEQHKLLQDIEKNKNDPAKVQGLKVQLKDIEENQALIQSYLDEQNKELIAVKKRFDEEQATLQAIWEKKP